MKTIKFLKSLFWNTRHKTPNPVGIFLVGWVLSLIPFFIHGQTDQSMHQSMVISLIAVGASVSSFLFIWIKQYINKRKK